MVPGVTGISSRYTTTLIWPGWSRDRRWKNDLNSNRTVKSMVTDLTGKHYPRGPNLLNHFTCNAHHSRSYHMVEMFSNEAWKFIWRRFQDRQNEIIERHISMLLLRPILQMPTTPPSSDMSGSRTQPNPTLVLEYTLYSVLPALPHPLQLKKRLPAGRIRYVGSRDNNNKCRTGDIARPDLGTCVVEWKRCVTGNRREIWNYMGS